MKIGIFGGSFDPVHAGHIALARSAIESGKVDKVLFVPAAHQPFKPDRQPADGKDRIRMIEKAIEGTEGLGVSDYELSRPDFVSYTIDTLRAMQEKYGETNEICFILGADSFLKIHTWKRAEELIASFPLIVGVRPGYGEKELLEQKKFLEENFRANVTFLDNPAIDISSTEIRACAALLSKSGNSEMPDEIPEEIGEYLIAQGLYNS